MHLTPCWKKLVHIPTPPPKKIPARKLKLHLPSPAQGPETGEQDWGLFGKRNANGTLKIASLTCQLGQEPELRLEGAGPHTVLAGEQPRGHPGVARVPHKWPTSISVTFAFTLHHCHPPLWPYPTAKWHLYRSWICLQSQTMRKHPQGPSWRNKI